MLGGRAGLGLGAHLQALAALQAVDGGVHPHHEEMLQMSGSGGGGAFMCVPEHWEGHTPKWQAHGGAGRRTRASTPLAPIHDTTGGGSRARRPRQPAFSCLVDLGIQAERQAGAPQRFAALWGLLVGEHRVCGHDAGEACLKGDGAVLVQVPVEACKGEGRESGTDATGRSSNGRVSAVGVKEVTGRYVTGAASASLGCGVPAIQFVVGCFQLLSAASAAHHTSSWRSRPRS